MKFFDNINNKCWNGEIAFYYAPFFVLLRNANEFNYEVKFEMLAVVD